MSDREDERSLETPEPDEYDVYEADEALTVVPDEANAADAAEQHTRLGGVAERWPDGVPVEVNEADAAEQHWSVRDEQDEDDDYR